MCTRVDPRGWLPLSAPSLVSTFKLGPSPALLEENKHLQLVFWFLKPMKIPSQFTSNLIFFTIWQHHHLLPSALGPLCCCTSPVLPAFPTGHSYERMMCWVKSKSTPLTFGVFPFH